MGKRINEEVLHGERAEYGKQIVVLLAGELVALYGKSLPQASKAPPWHRTPKIAVRANQYQVLNLQLGDVVHNDAGSFGAKPVLGRPAKANGDWWNREAPI